MKATARNGDEWTGERNGDWWMYQDRDGLQYESKEVPVYRIHMDNAAQRIDSNGVRCIAPIQAP